MPIPSYMDERMQEIESLRARVAELEAELKAGGFLRLLSERARLTAARLTAALARAEQTEAEMEWLRERLQEECDASPGALVQRDNAITGAREMKVQRDAARAEVRELREGIGLMADSMEGSLSMPLDAVGYENAIADFVDDLRALLECGVGPMMLGRINRKARALLKGGE